jgi:hypothetical protein
MTKELEKGAYSLKPHDIIVYKHTLGVARQYTILSVIVGGLNDEGFVELESSVEPSRVFHFPIALLDAAIESGIFQIYEG